MSCLEKLRASRKDKEYFVRLRFYSDLNKNVEILSDLLIDDKIVTTDKDIINDRVTHKYKELFRDTGNKNRIQPLDDSVILYTDDIVKDDLFKLNLNKATSWDLIPGKSYEIFKVPKYTRFLTRLVNYLVVRDHFPEILTLGRLLCLNKDATNPGSIDSIRPIVIMGVLIKIIEFPLLKVLKRVKLNIGQIGFKERLGTEVNIARLV